MRNIVLGTAGHIDHGKTALVRALTGIDTDRLAEEKRRGISIDLGFAHLQLGDAVRIGFVDVPGHERFVKNMLAGVGGIDLVLLVIAADESVMPQTREHFDICRLLNIPGGVIALTKADLVDADILQVVRRETGELVKGSFLEGAPVVAVSSETGEGIEELRQQLARAASGVRPKDASRHFRLPIDRAFSMRGFGTVVTGTLIAGSVSAGQELEAHPIGARFRVRGIQVHGASAEKALAGQRTALNLAGTGTLSRGMTLTEPSRFRATRKVDCLFELLPSAKPLKHRAPVHFHAGTAEVVAEARLLETTDALKPGGRTFLRFLLREPVLLLPGDRFIVRMFSPVTTIGGGVVLEIAPPERMRRADAAQRLRALSEGPVEDRVALLVRESGLGMAPGDLVARVGLLNSEIEELCSCGRFAFLPEPQPWLLGWEEFSSLVEKLRTLLRQFHSDNPLAPGMAKEELRSRQLRNAPPSLLDALIRSAQDIVLEGDTVRLASHKLSLGQDEENALARIEAAFERAGLAAPATSGVLAAAGVELARARSLLQILIRRKRLVRVGEELLLHASAIEALRAMLARHKGGRFKVSEFKQWTGVSRKYAIPLLEYLDRERVTRRQGDERVVL